MGERLKDSSMAPGRGTKAVGGVDCTAVSTIFAGTLAGVSKPKA